MPLQHLQTLFHSLILLLSLISLCSGVLIDNCEIYQTFSESNLPPLCIKCIKHHILDSTATLCQQQPIQFQNCIQLSIFGDCQKCDCGFSLSSNQNTCIPSPIDLIGCEVINKDTICIRPKYDFLFLKTNTVITSIEYARGSHCEILDTKTGQCEQCHAGFKMISPSKMCVLHSPKLVNEFYSYFSQDGELHSRTIELIPSRYGVFPKINYCEKQSSKQINSTYISFCEICELGKILNISKTACTKSPFESCAKVSDLNQNQCEECLDNEHFYLTKGQGNNNNILTCVPRELTLLNPTERCLQWFNDSPRCKICLKGLQPTFEGCTIENNLNNRITPTFHFNEKNPQEVAIDIAILLQTRRNFCELFSDDTNTICLSCVKGMILDIQGQCQQQTDFNCYLVNTIGECLQCISLMHYDPQSKKCVLISNFQKCAFSLGTSADCKLFLLDNYIYEYSNFNNTNAIDFCFKYADNSRQYCAICQNLYFLVNNGTSCESITRHQDCYFSEGIIDKCALCKNGFILDEHEEVCVSQIKYDYVAKACTNRFYYRKNETDILCEKYSFLNYEMCFQFHEHKNECLECQSEYFLERGQCQKANNCLSTNGIDDYCYLGQAFYTYINKFGKAMMIDHFNHFTNQIENKCLYCDLDEKNTGVYIDDISTCKNINIVDGKYLNQCFSLVHQNEKIVCNLCSSLFYPDQTGICQEISDKNCEASGGRLDQCRLCKKFYSLNEKRFCISQPSQVIPFCKQIEGSRCKICQNGYYLDFFSFCLPISNPNCNESDGILDRCRVCSDGGLIIISQGDYSQVHCYEKECEKKDGETGCKPCKFGYSLIQRQTMINKSSVYFCIIQKIPHCEIEDSFQESCLKCSPGYFRSFMGYDYSSAVVCRPIMLDNCLDIGLEGRDCKKCQEGYQLLQSGQCFKQKSCKKFMARICIECQEQFYSQDGICQKIENCERQHQKTCNQCLPGYWKKAKNERQNESILEKQDQSEHNKMKIEIPYLRAVGLIVEKEINSIDWCFRIPHCNLSDGISQTCWKCDIGYGLIKGICVREKSNSKDDKNCRVFSMDQDINQIICMECKSLFYLEEKICKQLENSPPCVLSDGIHNNCLKCSLLGWILNVSTRECELISNCMISNGIDVCLQCEEGYVVNNSGVVCEILNINIENCEIYSYQRIKHLPAIISNSIKNLSKKTIDFELRTIEGYLQSEYKELDDLDNIEEVQDHPGCVSCKSPQFSSNFQECVLTDKNQLTAQNCLRFDEQLQMCTSCVNGFLQKQDVTNHSLFQCTKLHWYQQRNRGCQLFNINMDCWMCFDEFYLDKNGFCQPRIVLMQKCKVFNITKDECIECKSGYKLLVMKKQQSRNQVICFGLEPHEQVENCAEYLPNTNKCIQCKKFLKEKNVLEYVLNEELNVCEDVLRLMCREIDYSTKNCIQKYIENCEEYERDLERSTDSVGCLKCQKGYFLVHEGRECLQHDLVNNCLVYSRTQRSVCEVCEQQYYLDKAAMKCIINSRKNCQQSKKEQDFCQICENSFTIDYMSGDCIKSTITNCQSSTNSKDNEEICLKCQNNFKLVDSGKVCLLELFDFNCKIFDSFSKCLECNSEYLLNHNGLCIAISSSICQTSSCLEYSTESTEGDLRCKKCLDNFFLNESLECQPLDPNSDFQKEKASTEKRESNGQKEKISESEIEQRQSIISTILELFIHLVILIVVVIGLIICFRRNYLKRREKKRNIEDSREFEDEEEPQQQEQQQEQASTEIQLDTIISIKGSLENTLNQ